MDSINKENIKYSNIPLPPEKPSFPIFTAPVHSKRKNDIKEKTRDKVENFNHPFMDSLKEITKGIEHLIKQSELIRNQDPQFTIINNDDLCKLLKICSQTAANWRNEGILPYSQIKGKFYYKLSDIHELINDNVIKKKV